MSIPPKRFWESSKLEKSSTGILRRKAEADGKWYLLETTIYRGRPLDNPPDKAESRLKIKYIEVVGFDESRVDLDRKLWDKYDLTLNQVFKGVEP